MFLSSHLTLNKLCREDRAHKSFVNNWNKFRVPYRTNSWGFEITSHLRQSDLLTATLSKQPITRRDRRLPLRFTWILPSSGLLGSGGWLSTDVSRQPIVPIFKGQLRYNPEDGRIQAMTTPSASFRLPFRISVQPPQCRHELSFFLPSKGHETAQLHSVYAAG